MSWDPDTDILLPPAYDALSSVAIAVAFALPLLLLARLFAQFA